MAVEDPKTGEKSIVKISDNSDAYLYKLSDNTVNMIGDIGLAAMVFNAIQLSEKVMFSLNNALNFDKIVEAVKKQPKTVAIYAKILQDKLNLARALNLTKSPAGQAAKKMFIEKCFNTFKQMPGVALQLAKR